VVQNGGASSRLWHYKLVTFSFAYPGGQPLVWQAFMVGVQSKF